MSHGEHRLSRRDFVKLTAAGAALGAVGLGASPAGGGEEKKKARAPVGLQLYSLRKECEKDLPGMIKAVGAMGYDAVEFAGYYGRDAKQLRELLDGANLKCCGTHIGLDTLLGDQLPRTIEFNKTIGNKFLVVPGLPGERTRSVQAWTDTAKVFSEIAEKVKPHGMRVGYHNHSMEFKPIDGKMPWEVFFGNTTKDVVMQVDIGNALGGGGDPLAVIKKFPGRTASIHAKEFSKSKPDAVIGEGGELNWKEYIDACENIGGIEWYIVEYEHEKAPLESVKKCLVNLKKLLAS
jgi:sugar phosphate isomerase/epimerase